MQDNFRCANRGHAPLLSTEQKQSVAAFVKRLRSTRFCTASYIIRELKLARRKKTVDRVLNESRLPLASCPNEGQALAGPTRGEKAPRNSIICDPFDNSFAVGTHFVTVCDSFVTDL